MMNEKNFKMNDSELDFVVGGTVGELNGLVSSCAKNPILKEIAGFGTHIPGANTAASKLMVKQLDQMGIEANIDLGFGGTGINSKHNTYLERSTGNSLSQIEVENRLEKYAV